MLGAGLVARPAVRYLLDEGYQVTIATRTLSKAEALLAGHESGRAAPLDLVDPVGLDQLIGDSDLVISLVPYTLHVQVARRCLALGRSMVTTSYVSNEMRELSTEAKSRGLLLLNETGVDPGIDHMSAMRIIDDVQARGGRVTSFRSYCGGLPAPTDNNNPWGYKFSWSPQGVLMAGRNSGRYLEEGKVIDIEPDDLFAVNFPVQVAGVGQLECYANRNALPYMGLYGLKDASTMFRGTLRYPGWCEMMKCLVDLGWVDFNRPPVGVGTYGHVTARLAGLDGPEPGQEALREAVARRTGVAPQGEAMARLEYAGLLSSQPLPEGETLLDLLSAALLERLVYDEGERDMIVLLHEFEATTREGNRERISSTLVDYGISGGDSAMSRTVSLPCAIVSKLYLEGRIDAVGVHIPVSASIYGPVLDALEEMGIVCEEKRE